MNVKNIRFNVPIALDSGVYNSNQDVAITEYDPLDVQLMSDLIKLKYEGTTGTVTLTLEDNSQVADSAVSLTVYEAYLIDTFNNGVRAESLVSLKEMFKGDTGATGPTGNVNLTGGGFFPIWAEENAATVDNTYEWAYGNGAATPVGGGIIIPIDCYIHSMSNTDNGVNGAVVSLEIDGVASGATSTAGSYTTFGDTEYYVPAGSRVNFKTVTGSAGTPQAVCAWFRTDGVVGPQGPAGANGTNGTNGSDGAQGPQGPAGPAGSGGGGGSVVIPYAFHYQQNSYSANQLLTPYGITGGQGNPSTDVGHIIRAAGTIKTLTLAGTGTGVGNIEYSLNGGSWTTLVAGVSFAVGGLVITPSAIVFSAGTKLNLRFTSWANTPLATIYIEET